MTAASATTVGAPMDPATNRVAERVSQLTGRVRPTQTMAVTCGHGREVILSMDHVVTHMGGAWEPCLRTYVDDSGDEVTE